MGGEEIERSRPVPALFCAGTSARLLPWLAAEVSPKRLSISPHRTTFHPFHPFSRLLYSLFQRKTAGSGHTAEHHQPATTEVQPSVPFGHYAA